MEIRIQSIKFDATEKLQEHIQKKAKKIERIFDEAMSLDFYLKIEKPEAVENKVVDVKLIAPSVELFASKTCDSFEESVDLCLDALEKQIIKHKEKTARN